MISIAIFMFIYGDQFQHNALVPSQDKYFKSAVWPFYAGIFLVASFSPLFLMNNPEVPRWIGYWGVLYYVVNQIAYLTSAKHSHKNLPLMRVGVLMLHASAILAGIVMLRVMIMSKHMNANHKRLKINRAHLHSLLKKAHVPVLTPRKLNRSSCFLGLKEALGPFFHAKEQGGLTEAAVLVLEKIESSASKLATEKVLRPPTSLLPDKERLIEIKATWSTKCSEVFDSIFPSFHKARGKRLKRIDSLTYLPTMLLVSSGLAIIAILTLLTLGIVFNKPVSEGSQHAVDAFTHVLNWNNSVPMDVSTKFFETARQGVDRLLQTSAQMDAVTSALNQSVHRMQDQGYGCGNQTTGISCAYILSTIGQFDAAHQVS
jgi:hypothetical protein